MDLVDKQTFDLAQGAVESSTRESNIGLILAAEAERARLRPLY
jgi:hypothetical protein